MSDTIDHNDKHTADHLERQRTAGNHFDDRSQPGLPVIHRTFASPAPLGLLSFATGIFLISVLGLHARSIDVPNILVGVLIFFGGIGQFAAGVMEFMTGNTGQALWLHIQTARLELWKPNFTKH
ncbi:hypothetical protein N7536_009770 [Penicillium majusculum]|nr:hypothetical protein N7536_009770 [Penicillium majusculum]